MRKEDVALITFNRDVAYIRFSIVAEEWPIDQFTRQLGVIPTQAYKKGDSFIRGKRKQTRFETVWTIEKEFYKRYEDHEDSNQIESLIEPLKSKIELINNYKKAYDLTCIFFIHHIFYDTQTPGIRLEPNILSFANSIGAIIDVYIDNEETL